MKPLPPLKPIMGFENTISINLIRLRRRVQQIAPGTVAPPRRPQSNFLRRKVIKARTGGHCRG